MWKKQSKQDMCLAERVKTDACKKIKKRAFEIVQVAAEHDKLSRAFDLFIITLIIVNVGLVIADTFTLPDSVKAVTSVIELVSVIIFTLEYVVRLWTADMLYPEIKPFRARIKYVFTFMAIIDLLAILPFYVPFLIPIDLRVLRTLRVIRLFRLFKVSRYTTALTTISMVFKRKASQLLSSMFVVALLMVIASVLMYNVESAAQPDVFQNAFSGIWWAIATLTTVGYGDIYPITFAGKVLSGIIALLGIGLVAVPTGIISAGFMETLNEKKEHSEANCNKKFCPYCGHRVDE